MDDSVLIILDGCTFMYSDPAGDVEADEAEGFFYQDVRHLSSWRVLVDGRPVERSRADASTTTPRASSAAARRLPFGATGS